LTGAGSVQITDFKTSEVTLVDSNGHAVRENES
jgi:hypothetical protein